MWCSMHEITVNSISFVYVRYAVQNHLRPHICLRLYWTEAKAWCELRNIQLSTVTKTLCLAYTSIFSISTYQFPLYPILATMVSSPQQMGMDICSAQIYDQANWCMLIPEGVKAFLWATRAIWSKMHLAQIGSVVISRLTHWAHKLTKIFSGNIICVIDWNLVNSMAHPYF